MREEHAATALRHWKPLGELLVEAGVVDHAGLARAVEAQAQSKELLGQVLHRLGMASQKDISRALARQLALPYVDLDDVVPQEQALLALPEHLARQLQVVPLSLTNGTLRLGMVDPVDVLAIDDVRRHTGQDIDVAVITPDHFLRALNAYPSPGESVASLTSEITTRVSEEMDVDHLRSLVDEAPVVRLVNLITLQAVRQHASDIHIEPQTHQVRVRYRIDGILYNAMTLPQHVHAAVVSRLKIMADIDIAERRLPQDGRIHLEIDKREIDIRVSTIPTIDGEKCVLRILDKSEGVLGLEKIGLLPENLRRFRSLIEKPHGIVLLTGPTGSGKTTTLYAIMNQLNSTKSNIIAIEDPVEYQIPGVNQVQVNPKAGLTFAKGLRSFLRQDPDVIMVGEIRDEETARIAIHAALTGHLVLSTLHTNDAPGALTRLIDMGIEPFLVASSVIGVIAQRLVRVLCDRCKQAYEPPSELLQRLEASAGDGGSHLTFWRPVGCEFCNSIGYRGRTGIFEIMIVDEGVKALLTRGASASAIKAEAIRADMRTLALDGLEKAAVGVTSPEEVLDMVYFED
jgi:type IV pilus assembly protein PilB